MEQQQPSPSVEPTSVDRLLTPAELAGMFSIKRYKVQRLTAEGRFDAFTVRLSQRTIRYSLAGAQRWLNSQRGR